MGRNSYDYCPYKKGKVGPKETQKGKIMWSAWERMTIFKPKGERRLEQIPLSQPSDKINPADTLILDLQPPELWNNKFLLFKPICGTLYGRPEAMRTFYFEVHTNHLCIYPQENFARN